MIKLKLLALLLVLLIGSCSEGETIIENIPIDDLVLEDNYVKDLSFKVVGYLPTYRFSEIEHIDFSALNYVNIAFGNLNQSGLIEVGDNVAIKNIVRQIKSQGPKVLLSIGGGGFSEETISNWIKGISATNRKQTIEGILQFVERNDLDGIDVDFEGELLKRSGVNYNFFVEKLEMYLHHKNLAMTAAVNARNWYDIIPKSTYQKYDFLNLMTYDATGPWNMDNPGPHSSIDFTMSSVDYWKNEQQNPTEKIVMGISFYGRNFDPGDGKAYTYRTIIESNIENAYHDQAGQTYYNGIPTVVEKVILAMEHTNGIMIWELGQDMYNELSLLNTAKQVLELRDCIESGGVVQMYFKDADKDGLGDASKPIQSCDPPEGYVDNRNDTNDMEPVVV